MAFCYSVIKYMEITDSVLIMGGEGVTGVKILLDALNVIEELTGNNLGRVGGPPHSCHRFL